MLSRTPKPHVCQQLLVRSLSEKRKTRAPPKRWHDKNPKPQPPVPFRQWRLNKTGPSWDKTMHMMEARVLEYFDNHAHKTEKPYVVTDRVADVSEVLPGVAVGTQFFDGFAGDTMTEGNEDAAVIENFLHLTPPMIRAHTDELKKLCTPVPEIPSEAIRQYTTNYVFPGPSIRHPLSREASIRVDLGSLDLSPEEREIVREMVGTMDMPTLKDIRHYEHFRLPKLLRDVPVVVEMNEKDELTIHSSQCPTRQQNLGLCYYRLSGFIHEAKSLKSVTREYVLPKIYLEFLFDSDEEKIRKFQEKQYVQFKRNEDGSLSGMIGSEEAIDNAIKLLNDVSHDLVDEDCPLPPEYSGYLLEHSSKFEELLLTHEAAYLDGKLVTYSSSLQNLREDLDDLISSLDSWQVDCPVHLHKFVMDPEMKKSLAADNDVLVIFNEDGKFTVTGPGTFRETVDYTIAGKIQRLKDDIVTETLPCTLSDINWEKMSQQFNVYLDVGSGSVRVTGEHEIVKEFGVFLAKKEARRKTQTN